MALMNQRQLWGWLRSLEPGAADGGLEPFLQEFCAVADVRFG
ncbi:hypothetical protein V8J82_14040 [Gymnodinialimonas sp. 2305UL16-5]